MAKKSLTKSITLSENEGTFSVLFKRMKGENKNTELSKVRQLLSNEKAKLLHTCKAKNPESIYKLAKILGRDFKAVREDVRLLEKYGFIELISSHKQGRDRLKPVVDLDQLIITINI